MSVKTAPVSELSEQIRGVTFAKSDAVAEPADGFLPVLRAGNITDNGVDFEDLLFVPADRINDRQMLRANDVLIAASSGSLSVVGKAARMHKDFGGGFGAFCKVLRPNQSVDPGYFSHYFQTGAYRHKISSLAAGANINNLRGADLDGLRIPLPPLPEQRRIAEILDRADALRAKRRQAITKLDSLTQSIFTDMFKVNGQTPLKPLDQIIDRIVVGHVGPTSEHFRDTGIPFLRTGNIGSKSVTSRDLKFISADFHRKLAKSQLRKGDVIISRVISDEVRCAVVPSEFDGANCANVVIVRPGRQTSAEYLANLIRQPASQRAFMQRKVGSAQGVVNTRTMASWLVPSPPLDEQRRFEARARAILSVLESMETSADSCDALFASLQHRAFSGQL